MDSPSIVAPTTPTNKSTTPSKAHVSNVFSPILKALNENSRMLVNAMEHINVMQLESEKHRSKIQKCKTKKYL